MKPRMHTTITPVIIPYDCKIVSNILTFILSVKVVGDDIQVGVGIGKLREALITFLFPIIQIEILHIEYYMKKALYNY